MFETDEDAKFVLIGIAEGFRLVETLDVIPAVECNNYSSALAPGSKMFLGELFREEELMGRITRQTSKPLRVQALGAVPKKGTDSLRPITDRNRPFSCSFNSRSRNFLF